MMQERHFCVHVHVKESVTYLSVNRSAATPHLQCPPPPPAGNLMLKYVSKDI